MGKQPRSTGSSCVHVSHLSAQGASPARASPAALATRGKMHRRLPSGVSGIAVMSSPGALPRVHSKLASTTMPVQLPPPPLLLTLSCSSAARGTLCCCNMLYTHLGCRRAAAEV